MNEKLKRIIYVVLGCFVLFFVVILLISSCGTKLKPDGLEKKIIERSKNYYSTHKDELPKENTSLTLSLDDLVNKKIIKKLDRLLDKNTTCTGTLTIENNNNYYMYSPNINCNTGNDIYNTLNLKETLLENVVTSGNGLYSIGDSYFFRGDNLNNYLVFDGLLWRIVKINDDGTIKVIEAGKRDPVVWDDRYNSETTSSTGINDYTNNNINSRIKDELDKIYQTKQVLTSDAKGYIKQTSLCIGKRGLEDTTNDGSIECSSRLDKQYLGLLQLNEYITASLDPNCVNANSISCSNYNYLASFKNSYWTITANKDKSSQVYKINDTVMATGASNSGMARIVINLSENTNVTGTGTENDPYVVLGMSKDIKKIKEIGL